MIPSLNIETSVEDNGWDQSLGNHAQILERMALAALENADVEWDAKEVEISVVLTNDAAIRVLNRDWRGKDKATNVLSFAALDDEDAPKVEGAPVLLGDLVFALETLTQEASDLKISLEDHFSHLVVHGVLHLLGYDHEDSDEDAEEMEELETSILAGFGIKNPYAEMED